MILGGLSLLPLLLGVGGALAYGEWQRKRGQDSVNKNAAQPQTDTSVKDKVQTVYNYNGFDDNQLGRSLFNTNPQKAVPQKTMGRNRSMFS